MGESAKVSPQWRRQTMRLARFLASHARHGRSVMRRDYLIKQPVRIVRRCRRLYVFGLFNGACPLRHATSASDPRRNQCTPELSKIYLYYRTPDDVNQG